MLSYELSEQFGAISFLVNTLLTEESDFVKHMYSKLDVKDKNLLFNRENIKIKNTKSIENRLIKKIKKIKESFYARRAKI